MQFAALTVIIALLGLFVLGIGFFNGLALAASLTVAMVMLSAVWFLPALLSLLGDKALAIRMPWARKTKAWHPEGGKWAHYGHVLQKRPWFYTLAAALLVMVMALFLTGHWMLRVILDYTRQLFGSIPTLIG